MYEKLG